MFDEADLAPLMVALLDQNKPRQYHNSQTTSLNSRLQALWDLYDDHSIAKIGLSGPVQSLWRNGPDCLGQLVWAIPSLNRSE